MVDQQIEKMKSYEANKDNSKINYLALSYDSILNRSVSMYTFGANEQAINVADVVLAADESAADSSKDSFIEKMFIEIKVC